MPRPDRLERLFQRRTSLAENEQITAKSFAAQERNKEHEYLVTAMQPIEAAYTNKTFEEAERVKSQLADGLPSLYAASFDYQGSVTSDTHIRVYSDIDLLVMHGQFVSLDVGAPNSSPYQGNITYELGMLRNATVSAVKTRFPAVTVDTKPGKSVALSGGSLARKIDVVIGNWWDTDLYLQYQVKMARGINILDSKIPSQIRNKPFLHNYNINDRDVKTGGLRKVIRFLKTLKYDAEQKVNISSYDIASVAYNMSDQALSVPADSYLTLAVNATAELKRIIDNSVVRDSLFVPNGTRKIFGQDGATLEGLKALHKEASDLVNSVQSAMAVRLYTFSESAPIKAKRGWNEELPLSVKAHMY